MGRIILVLTALSASPAAAFTFETQLSDGCHERITLDAIASAGWPDARSPTPPTDLDRRALDGLLFELPTRAREGWSMALLFGVRDNDLLGRSPTDLAGLSEVHNDPAGQAAHCLRSPTDDGPAGDGTALAACRAFIEAETLLAIGDDDVIDLDALDEIEVTLAFSGRLDLPVRRYGHHAGRALHALQDSFSHTLRSPDHRRVRHVLNFVDPALASDYSPERDGLAHQADADLCEHPPARVRGRAEMATRASTEYLRALALREGGRAGRIKRVGLVLDRYLGREEGCDASNRWCDAAEAMPSCAAMRTSGWRALVVVLTILMVGRRRLVGASLLILFTLATTAHADPIATATSTSALTKPDSPTTGDKSLYFAFSAALDEAALAGAVALRWQISEDFTVGADVEYNPWLSLEAARAAPGTINAYGTLVYRWWSIGDVDLRLTGHLGVSVLLFDLVGASAGSAGPYLGLSLLGVSFRVHDGLTLVIDPADIAFPVPSIAGVPFTYRQYRITVGIQWSS